MATESTVAAGTVRVRALRTVLDNGVMHAPGEEFEMERSLVAVHVAAGQVEAVKQQTTPRDKQVRDGGNK